MDARLVWTSSALIGQRRAGPRCASPRAGAWREALR